MLGLAFKIIGLAAEHASYKIRVGQASEYQVEKTMNRWVQHPSDKPFCFTPNSPSILDKWDWSEIYGILKCFNLKYKKYFSCYYAQHI